MDRDPVWFMHKAEFGLPHDQSIFLIATILLEYKAIALLINLSTQQPED